jgi:hypothetical protein
LLRNHRKPGEGETRLGKRDFAIMIVERVLQLALFDTATWAGHDLP